MVESIELVVFGGVLLIAGIAIIVNPALGEFNIGSQKVERVLGPFFGILSFVFGTGLLYLGI